MRESTQSLEARIAAQKNLESYPSRGFRSEDVPAERYTSEAFFRLEQERVFRGPCWLLAGHASRVARPGDYFTFESGLGGSVVVLRGRDGLRAFHNVCRHRGSEIVSGQGHAERLRCSYHGWSYDLDGRLVAVPDERQFAGLERARRGLRPVRVDAWQGWVWLSFSEEAPPLSEYLADFSDEFADYEFERWVVFDEDHWTFPVNWKVIVDAFNEVYHIPYVHPKTVTPFFDLRGGLMDTYRLHTRMTLPFAFPDAVLGAAREADLPVRLPSGLNRVQRNADMHYFVWPNVQWNLVPNFATLFAAYPLGVRSTRFDYAFLAIGPRSEPARKYYEPLAQSFRVALEEDFANFPRLQRGLDTGALDSLPLNYQEVRIRHFHRVLEDWTRGSES